MNLFDLLWFIASLLIVVSLGIGVIWPNIKDIFIHKNERTRR